jgi:hypothetical protein
MKALCGLLPALPSWLQLLLHDSIIGTVFQRSCGSRLRYRNREVLPFPSGRIRPVEGKDNATAGRNPCRGKIDIVQESLQGSSPLRWQTRPSPSSVFRPLPCCLRQVRSGRARPSEAARAGRCRCRRMGRAVFMLPVSVVIITMPKESSLCRRRCRSRLSARHLRFPPFGIPGSVMISFSMRYRPCPQVLTRRYARTPSDRYETEDAAWRFSSEK